MAYLVACGDPTPKNDPQAEAWSAQYDAGRAAFAQSRFAEAGAACTAAITLAEQFAPDDPRYGYAAHRLAQLHILQGKLVEAESLYIDLRKRETRLPAHSPAKVLTLEGLGDTYRLHESVRAIAGREGVSLTICGSCDTSWPMQKVAVSNDSATSLTLSSVRSTCRVPTSRSICVCRWPSDPFER